MKSITETWDELAKADPSLTKNDKALYYLGVSAGVATITEALEKHITKDLQLKMWPEIGPIVADVRKFTKAAK
jgi:hypothetical protein